VVETAIPLRGRRDPVTILLPFSARLSRAAAGKESVKLGFGEEKMPNRRDSLYQTARD
jgi:hypothetical protein